MMKYKKSSSIFQNIVNQYQQQHQNKSTSRQIEQLTQSSESSKENFVDDDELDGEDQDVECLPIK